MALVVRADLLAGVEISLTGQVRITDPPLDLSGKNLLNLFCTQKKFPRIDHIAFETIV